MQCNRVTRVDRHLKVFKDACIGRKLCVGGKTHLLKDTTLEKNLLLKGDAMFNDSLTVDGDVDIGENLNVTGMLTVDDMANFDSTKGSTGVDNGALVVAGGVGVGENLNVAGALRTGGRANIDSSIGSTGPDNGDLVVAGGVGIGENLHVQDDVQAGGSLYQMGYLLMPIGAVMPYAGSTSPDGYLLCDGSAVSRTIYNILFSVIGTTYGVGDGSTTFNLPNLTGRVILGVSGGNALATTGGSATQTLTTNELPAHTHTGTTNTDGAHTHTITDPGHTHTYAIGKDDGNLSNNNGQVPPGDSDTADYTLNTSSSTTNISIPSSGAHSHSFTTNSTGSGNSFSILNPYLSLNYIIKY